MTARNRLSGLVALVTGAGGGLGRAYALLLAQLGARVVVNDLGVSMDGQGGDRSRSQAVVDEIVGSGGRAVADVHDVGQWSGASAMVDAAVERFGRLDVLVNNAGILRPRTIVGMTEEEWTSVIGVHLQGTMAASHFAAVHWRARAKGGEVLAARLINVTSAAGLYGSGQVNYSSAKAGIAVFTVIAAQELAPYGVTANAVSPTAHTRMGVGIVPESLGADHAAHLVAWLASDASSEVTGRVFNVTGGHVSIADGWHTGASADKDGLWSVDDLDGVVPGLVAEAAPRADLLGYYPGEPRATTLPDVRYPDR